MIFINTRPTNRAYPLSEAMQGKGLRVIELPLLELAAGTISEIEQGYQNVLVCMTAHQTITSKPNPETKLNPKLKNYNALVVVSPSAARLGLAALPNGVQPACPVIAVGNATAEVLQQVGWQVQLPAESSNEGMLQMTELAALAEGDNVLIWRGQGGRRLLVTQLQDRGVNVDAIAWYKRCCPPDLSLSFKTIEPFLVEAINATLDKPIVLISSGVAFDYWCGLFDEVSSLDLSNFSYLTFGKRLTDIVGKLNLPCITLDSLAAEDVLRGVSLLQNGIA